MLLLYPFFYILLSNPKWHGAAFKLKQCWAHLLMFGLLSPVRVKYEGTLPNEAFVICANHTSYIDIIVMYLAIPKLFLFMGKAELLKWPLFNIFFKKMDIAVNRRSSVDAGKAYKKAKQALENGVSMALFPEGTIPNNPPQLKIFKNGAFRLALEQKCPIVPVSFIGNYKVLGGDVHKWNSWARPGLIKVIVHPAIETKSLSETELVPLRNKVFQILEQDQIEHGNYK